MAMQLTTGGAGRSLEENLRTKYANPGCQTGLDAAIQQQVATIDGACCTTNGGCRPRQTAGDVEVKPCAKCQGTGEIKELYGYRVMTTPCENCSGIGCLTFRKGKLVREEEAAGQRTAPKREKPVWAQRPNERIAKLKEQVAQIRGKKAAYESEIAQLKASVAVAADTTGKQLQEDLIVQLESYVNELYAPLAKREDSLHRYTNPSLADVEDGEAAEEMPDLE